MNLSRTRSSPRRDLTIVLTDRFGFDTLELAKAFVDNPSLKAKMTEAGIVGTRRIEINEEVESS